MSESWYEVVERRKNFISRLTFDRKNLLALCYVMEQATVKNEKKCRSWKNHSQLYSYFFYKNFNSFGRYIRVVATKGSSKVAIIIPENSNDEGWCDYAKKIRLFIQAWAKQGIQQQQQRSVNVRSYMQTAEKEKWPKDVIKIIMDGSLNQNQFRIDANSIRSRVEYHRKCVRGYFKQDGMKFYSCQEIQEWANKTWKVPAVF